MRTKICKKLMVNKVNEFDIDDTVFIVSTYYLTLFIEKKTPTQNVAHALRFCGYPIGCE